MIQSKLFDWVIYQLKYKTKDFHTIERAQWDDNRVMLVPHKLQYQRNTQDQLPAAETRNNKSHLLVSSSLVKSPLRPLFPTLQRHLPSANCTSYPPDNSKSRDLSSSLVCRETAVAAPQKAEVTVVAKRAMLTRRTQR